MRCIVVGHGMKDVLEDVPGQMKNGGIVATELPMKVLYYDRVIPKTCEENKYHYNNCDTTSATVSCV